MKLNLTLKIYPLQATLNNIKIAPNFRSNRKKQTHIMYRHYRTYINTTSTSILTISSMSECSLEVSFCCAPWPELACSHQWFHGWLQLFLDYSCVVFGAKGKTRLTRLWICELSWKARGLVLMERKWTHTSRAHTLSTFTHTYQDITSVWAKSTLNRTLQLDQKVKKELKTDALFCFNAAL